MHVADADHQMDRFYAGWLAPIATSLAGHLGLLILVLAFHASWDGGSGIINAEALDIADSNSVKKAATTVVEKRGTREISNQEMVERLTLPMGLPRSLKCSLAVTVAQDGQVLEAVVTQSTGNPEFDRSIVEAVYKVLAVSETAQ